MESRLPRKVRAGIEVKYSSFGWSCSLQNTIHSIYKKGKQIIIEYLYRILEEAYELERELKMHYEKLMLQTMQSLAIFYNMSGKRNFLGVIKLNFC